MKAIINGISVEGTPVEILEYQKLIKDDTKKSLQDNLDKTKLNKEITDFIKAEKPIIFGYY